MSTSRPIAPGISKTDVSKSRPGTLRRRIARGLQFDLSSVEGWLGETTEIGATVTFVSSRRCRANWRVVPWSSDIASSDSSAPRTSLGIGQTRVSVSDDRARFHGPLQPSHRGCVEGWPGGWFQGDDRPTRGTDNFALPWSNGRTWASRVPQGQPAVGRPDGNGIRGDRLVPLYRVASEVLLQHRQ